MISFHAPPSPHPASRPKLHMYTIWNLFLAMWVHNPKQLPTQTWWSSQAFHFLFSPYSSSVAKSAIYMSVGCIIVQSILSESWFKADQTFSSTNDLTDTSSTNTFKDSNMLWSKTLLSFNLKASIRENKTLAPSSINRTTTQSIKKPNCITYEYLHLPEARVKKKFLYCLLTARRQHKKFSKRDKWYSLNTIKIGWDY